MAAGGGTALAREAWSAAIDWDSSSWAAVGEAGRASDRSTASGFATSILGADNIVAKPRLTCAAAEVAGFACHRLAARGWVTQRAGAATAWCVELELLSCTAEGAFGHVVATCWLLLTVAHTALGGRPQDKAVWVIGMVRYTPLKLLPIAVDIQCGETL